MPHLLNNPYKISIMIDVRIECKSDYRRVEIGKLGKRMSTRQQALATAQVYLRRFYSKVEIRRTNPFLVMATAFYLACKMEECPQHIRVVVGEARQIWQGTETIIVRQ